MTREQTHLANGGAYLNIGLLVGHPGYKTYLPVFSTLRTLRNYGAKFHHSTIQKSDTEDTLVVELDGPIPRRVLFEIASALNQEAIAQCMSGMDGNEWGELVGPKAEAWGEFDPERFLLLDGCKLSEIDKHAK